MHFVRLLIGGIATGVGLRAGSDLYDRFTGKKSADDARKSDEFNPFRERDSQSSKAEVDADV